MEITPNPCQQKVCLLRIKLLYTMNVVT